MLVAGVVSAAPADEKRVLLADADPELRRAVEASLKPWRMEVVVDPGAPSDLAAAEARAEGRNARFVVWRDGAELVLYDRDSAAIERRVAQAGAFDKLGAAAAALTVKTMMRLPPPPPDDTVATTPPAVVTTVPQPDTDGIELQLDALIAERYEVGLDTNFALRFGLRGMVRPWRDLPWEFGALGDFGASADVEQAGFRGTWTNWAALGVIGLALPYGIEPWLGAGIEHSALDGIEMTTPRSESTTLLALRGGAIWRYRLGMWTVGAGVTVETLGNTVTYTKMRSSNAIFEVPPFSVVGALVVGADIDPK